jgi:hypothetical protein
MVREARFGRDADGEVIAGCCRGRREGRIFDIRGEKSKDGVGRKAYRHMIMRTDIISIYAPFQGAGEMKVEQRERRGS